MHNRKHLRIFSNLERNKAYVAEILISPSKLKMFLQFIQLNAPFPLAKHSENAM